jgi:hypothetical protein
MAVPLPIVAMFLTLNSFEADTTVAGGLCAGDSAECAERYATMEECVKRAERTKPGPYKLRFFCVDMRELPNVK